MIGGGGGTSSAHLVARATMQIWLPNLSLSGSHTVLPNRLRRVPQTRGGWAHEVEAVHDCAHAISTRV